jgi:hypothetical protein
VGQAALDLELASIGELPVGQNPNFRELPLFVGRSPLFHLEVDGVAPMYFLFGPYFEVDISGFAEAYVFPTVDIVGDEQLRIDIRRLLRSSFTVTRRRKQLTLRGFDTDGTHWIGRTQRDNGTMIEGTFAPYFSP